MKRSIVTLLVILPILLNAQKIWSEKVAYDWHEKQPWIVGCNFIPSTAINELEMWQSDTFDPVTINRELGWASDIGFNAVRVYLHNLVWETDAEDFKKRLNDYLSIADSHNIKTIFVLFDDCWNPDPGSGKQPLPKPGVHNSGWLQAPGKKRVLDPSTWGPLESYTKDILATFGDDKRILMWDLYNEPGNSDLFDQSLPLLKKVFEWAWQIRPSQPLSCGTWSNDDRYKTLNEFQLNNSDVITFHNYSDAANLEQQILVLQKMNRPLLCTEYMARTNNSTFESSLPVMKKYNVGAINWGLVSGKTNTIFPWGSKEGSPEPEVWFHDIFRADGTPFNPGEIRLIRKLTGKEK